MDQDASQAWDPARFERFSRFKHLLTEGLGQHGLEAIHRHPPPMASRVLDVGCGFGDSTIALALRTGPHGTATGVDRLANFVQAARSDAAAQGCSNARFIVADVQHAPLEGPYDYAFSRFGTLLYGSPALRNVRLNLHDDGRLVLVVWRKPEADAWLRAAELCARELVPNAHASSMTDADQLSDQLRSAGFAHGTFERFDCEICLGRDLDEAVSFAMALGPVAEILQQAGAEAPRLEPQLAATLREVLANFAGPKGVLAPSSSWIITARPA
jgi:ubiquinone/menaquinone biosynthesis C-methylase UbiE